MARRKTALAAVLITTATVAVAHQGVKDPVVKARMDGMASIAASTKVIAQMVKGRTPMDIDAARAAASRLHQDASAIEALFASRADDPVSEASPEIWDDFSDFRKRARGLERAAARAEQAETPRDLKTAFGAIGKSCQACHREYRE